MDRPTHCRHFIAQAGCVPPSDATERDGARESGRVRPSRFAREASRLVLLLATASCASHRPDPGGPRVTDQPTDVPETPPQTKEEPTIDWSRGVRLEDALRAARSKSRSLAEARARAQLSPARLVTAGQFPFNPELDFEGSSDFLFGGNGESNAILWLVQEFETGGQRHLRQDVARAGIRSDEASVRDAERLLEADVVTAFCAGLQLQKRVELADAALAIAKQFLDLAEKRLAASDIAEAQVLPLRLDVARAEGEVQRRWRQLIAGKLLLVAVMGEEPRSDFELVGELPGAPETGLEEPQLRRRMVEHRPDLERLRHRIEQAEAAALLAKAERAPDVKLGVGLEHAASQLDVNGQSVHDHDNLIGFSISVPLPIFNRRAGEMAEAQAEIGVSRAELDVKEMEAISALSSALERLRAATEREAFLRERVLPLAEASVEAMRRGFETGEVATIDVLQAQDRLRSLREEHEEARFEVASARVGLEAEVGGPVEGTPRDGGAR